MPMFCYRKGLKEGFEMAQGKAPHNEPITSKKPEKMSEEQLKYIEGLNNLLSYDGEPQGVSK